MEKIIRIIEAFLTGLWERATTCCELVCRELSLLENPIHMGVTFIATGKTDHSCTIQIKAIHMNSMV